MNQKLQQYARLVVETGVNIEKNQLLVVNALIECASFTRLIAQAAYEAGARDVIVNWKDELLGKIRFQQAPEEVFNHFPSWQREFYLGYLQEGAAFISIAANDPELLKDVDPNRVSTAQKTAAVALEHYRKALMSNQNAWCVVSVPTVAWARKVFPGQTDEQAVEQLWQAIFNAVRVQEADPVAAWKQHKANLEQRLEWLNKHNFQYLHYKNSLGTDLKVALPDGHIWLGGAEKTAAGREFIANMPTEEVFTLPKRDGVDGVVVSSKPLNYNGSLIEDFSLTFKAGKIIAYQAAAGEPVLQQLLQSDEGACYLGEVALVPDDSPISRSNILFYNTLFDENASCHLAFGKAYPVCIKNGEHMTDEELAAAGVNHSLVHEDFMIGTADLEITGVTKTGEQVAVFRKGNFAF